MSPHNGIYWLSSYPKSGNTWFRIFLAHVLSLSGLLDPDRKQLTPINEVDYWINDHIATARTWVNEACGFNTAWLTDDELDALMPRLYQWYSSQQSKITYHKIHRAYTYLDNQQPLLPTEGCLGTIYIIRNPLDVAISMANHFSCSIDDAISMMADPCYALHYYPLRQTLLSWSMHVKSWEEAKEMKILMLRYEDMLTDPLTTFTKALHFLQLDVPITVTETAIAHSSFDTLQQFEENVGFFDKPPTLKHFFRKGIAGDWQNTLSKQQIQRIIDDHGEVMDRWGYINDAGEPKIG